MSEVKSLASKLASIGKEIGAVSKSGKNQQQHYDFIEYSVVAGKIRELFDKYHIIIIPSVDSVSTDEIKSKYDTSGYHYVLTMTFTLINGDDKEDREIASWTGEASDFGDKGINKAETAGTKYFLMRLFNISEKGDDNDENSVEVASSQRASRYSKQELAEAELRLSCCANIDELKETYQSLGDIAYEYEIKKYTNDMKKKLGE